MEKVLEEINLGTLIERFKEESIDPESVAALTDQDLSRLGVHTIGDRVRLRTLCQRKLADKEAQNSQNLTTSVILQERSTLFALGSTSRKASGSKRKDAGRPKRTWTVQFICLADRYSTRVPTTTERQILHKAGLGLKKIKLDLEEDEHAVREKLMSDAKEEDGSSNSVGFPQLRSSGGFEMMQCASNCRNLSVIDVNWAAKSLTAFIGGSQAKIYLRPIQKSLSTKPLADEKSESLIKERCNICHQEVLVRELRSHIWNCTDSLIQQSDHSDDDNATTVENTRASQPATTSSQTNSPNIITIPDESDRIPERGPASALPSENEMQSEDNATIENEVENAVRKTISYCNENNVVNPVEILRCLQKNMVIGRALDVKDPSQSDDGATNFILVDRGNLLETGFDEINTLGNLRITLEVQFYNEGAQDLGGPRKEFFRLILKEIKEHYFDNGLRELLEDNYYIVGKIMGLSMLQNGRIPTFMAEDIIQKIFSATEESSCIMAIRNGLKEVGVYQVGHQLPILLHLLRAVPLNTLTLRKLTNMLQPCFSEEGSNNRKHENEAYAAFLKYLREVAGGKRENLTLNTVLQFCTGTDEEPIMGFSLHPSLVFAEVLPEYAFIPTANTCINRMTLPRASLSMPLPQPDHLFNLYDYAFANSYFGNR